MFTFKVKGALLKHVECEYSHFQFLSHFFNFDYHSVSIWQVFADKLVSLRQYTSILRNHIELFGRARSLQPVSPSDSQQSLPNHWNPDGSLSV